MGFAYSPLRYPGGKTRISELVSDFISVNSLEGTHYAEPYAGGSGLALSLLYGGYVSDIHINDIDDGIWAFWSCVLNDTDGLLEKLEGTPITLDEWEKQREIWKTGRYQTKLDLGFATFFLNRTNRSGIIRNAGMIGGREQSGKYKIDCRFNKTQLGNRIRQVARYRERIHLTNRDAVEFMAKSKKNLPSETFFYFDPPYYSKGASLYTNFYREGDHSRIAKAILGLPQPWILTYDKIDEIKSLYSARRRYCLDINYSVNVKRQASELLITSKGLRIPRYFKDHQCHRPRNFAA